MFGYRPIEFDIYIPPDGEVYYFNDGLDRFVLSSGGYGMPDIEYQTQRAPFQDGSTPLGFTLNSRVVQLIHRVSKDCRDDYWQARSALINGIRPNRRTRVGAYQTGTLRKILGDGTKRDLCVGVMSTPEFSARPNDEWDEFGFTEVIRFLAFDPTFFNPDKNILFLQLGESGDQLQYPVEFPIQFSEAAFVAQNNLPYAGTYRSYPTIYLTGPMRRPIISNVTTLEFIELNTEIPANRTVIISLAPGNKTVTDDAGNNLIGSVTPESDLATFHLEPSPLAIGGVNEIGFIANLTDANSVAAIHWFDRYIGI